MSQIQIDYGVMEATAADIKTYAQQVRDAITALRGDIDQLTPTWEGEARKAFDESYAAGAKELVHFPAMLEELHSALVFAADAMRKAESASAATTSELVVSDRS
jgi:WXG100 family type VII secretion target